jgi:hypothetical protein
MIRSLLHLLLLGSGIGLLSASADEPAPSAKVALPAALPPKPAPPANSAGFRNPGRVGRVNEYYPAGERFQNPGRGAAHAPSFGAYPDFVSRPAQVDVQRVGIARARALDRHIDAYGRPNVLLWVPWIWRVR